MSEAPDDRMILSLFRAGDEQAARKLYDRYVDRLVALASRRISQRLASRVDPEDVVQSVFRSFFGRVKKGQFRIADQDDLCKLLMRITVHKTLRQIAFHKAAKRNPSLESGQDDSALGGIKNVFSHEPSPEAEVAFLDQLEHFFAQLRPEERQILEMRLQGYSNEDIARKLGIYDRKIRRVIERVRAIAEHEGLSLQK